MARVQSFGGISFQFCRKHLTFFIACALLIIVYCMYSKKIIFVNLYLWSDPCQNIGSLIPSDPQLVTCLKSRYLQRPSTEPYNLNDASLDVNPTQDGQNLFIHKILEYKKNGFFIECGALDGELYSNTLYLERNFGWTGLLIEAESGNYRNLTKKHRKAWTSNSCLSPSEKAENLTLVGIDYGGGPGGLSLMHNSETLKNFGGYVGAKRLPEYVQCFPIHTYFLALGITEVDYFSLDVEGADFEILKTVPFDKIIFKVLEVEVHWVKEGKAEVRNFLEQRGYIYVQEMGADYIFIHNSVKLPDGMDLGLKNSNSKKVRSRTKKSVKLRN